MLFLGACGDGQLVVSLSLPRDKRLDPTAACPTAAPCDHLDERLVRFSLRIHDRDALSSQEALFEGPGTLALGKVPVGRPLDLELSGQSASGQMLGVGRVFGVEVADKDETLVAINFRKPIAYIAGGGALMAVDTASQNPGFSAIPSIPSADLRAAATAPNGVLIAMATSTRVTVYDTSEHRKLLDLPLDKPAAGPAGCLRFTPDSRYLFICRAIPHLSSLDVLSPNPEVVGGAIAGGVPHDVTFSADGRRGYVLVQGIDHLTPCAGAKASQILRMSVDSRWPTHFNPELPMVKLAAPVSDIEAHPEGKKLLLAQPCQGVVSEISMEGPGTPKSIEGISVGAPYDIAVTREQIAVLGANGERGAIVLKSQAATQRLDFAIPPIQISLANTGSSAGSFEWASRPQGKLAIYDSAISPDGQRAVALYRLRFTSDLKLNTCTFQSDLMGTGYLLIDLSSGAVLLNKMTKLDFAKVGCSAPCLNINGIGSLAVQANCEKVFRSALRGRGAMTASSFAPSAVTILFGGS